MTTNVKNGDFRQAIRITNIFRNDSGLRKSDFQETAYYKKPTTIRRIKKLARERAVKIYNQKNKAAKKIKN